MLKINEANYNQFKHIFEILWEFQAPLAGLDPNAEYSPINVLAGWEKKSKTLARRGLKEGLRDTLTDMMDLPNSMKNDIDKKLQAKGFLNFNQLISIIKDIPAKVLKRGKIRTMDEYYIIKEIFSDISHRLNDNDRSKLEKLYFDFENSFSDKKNAS